MLGFEYSGDLREAFKKKFGESWDIVPTGRGGTLSLHISVPTKKITCSEWIRTYNKVIKLGYPEIGLFFCC